MKTVLLAIALLAATHPALGEEPPQPIRTWDTSDIRTIRIVGDAASITLTTDAQKGFLATLGARRSGWFAGWYSSWFFNDCRTQSRMHAEGDTLVVEAQASSWAEPADCEVELEANLAEGAGVAIRQAASQVRLQGSFSAVSLDNQAADFTLDGHAETVRLEARALRSHLDFARTLGRETIEIRAQSLDAYLGFAPGTAISYDVEAKAALVDSRLPNTPGATPSVVIASDYVRAVIR